MRKWLIALCLCAPAFGPALGQTSTPQLAETFLRNCLASSSLNQSRCEQARRQFATDLSQARSGIYQGQRAVAQALSGADGRTETNPVVENVQEGCAWRLVLLLLGHPEAGLEDVRLAARDCQRPEIDERRAEARAAELRRGMRRHSAPVQLVARQADLPPLCREIIARNAGTQGDLSALQELPAACRR